MPTLIKIEEQQRAVLDLLLGENDPRRILKKSAIMAGFARNPPGRYPLVTLPSGVQLSFSYQGRPVTPNVAQTLAQGVGSSSERGMWTGGLALLANLAAEISNV